MTPGSIAERRRLPSSSGQSRDGSAVARLPALSIRHKVSERRRPTVHRHTARLTTRFVTLLLGDLVAFFVYKALATALDNAQLVGEHLRFRFGEAMAVQSSTAGWLFAGLLLFGLFLSGSYSRHRALNARVRLLGAAALASILVLATTASASGWTPAALLYLFTVLLTWTVLVGERHVTEVFLRKVWLKEKGAVPALLIMTGESTDQLVERAILSPGGDYLIASRMQSTGESMRDDWWRRLTADIERNNIEAVVLCGDVPPSRMRKLIDVTLNLGCQLLYPARAVKAVDVRPTLVWHGDQPFFELGAPVLKATALITKRIVDVIGSVTALVICAPLLVLIAVCIKIDSHGPVLFVQNRAGLGGKRFRMLKFRTMNVGADLQKKSLAHLNLSGDRRLFKIKGDPRITRLGHFLRRWSLDELPQFVNVLTGDMSLVGPRPFFESDFMEYEDHHFRRLDAKPGITGLWQVSGGSEVLNFEDVVFLDRQYIEQWSIWLDARIMFRTVPAVARRSGIY